MICTQAESYTAADAETIELPEKEEETAQAVPDPFAKLEKGVEDRRRGREGAERIAELRADSEAKYKDDYSINKALRRQLRCRLTSCYHLCTICGLAHRECSCPGRSLQSGAVQGRAAGALLKRNDVCTVRKVLWC